jgi:hypothetical protein
MKINVEDMLIRRLPQVILDDLGNITAAWEQELSGFYSDIYANRFDAASNTWGNPTKLQDDSLDESHTVKLGLLSNGDAIAVWYDDSDGVWSRRLNATTNSWDSESIKLSDDDSAISPRVAVSSNDTVMAVWSEFSSEWHIKSSLYDVNSGVWSTPVFVDLNTQEPATEPQVCFAGNNNATIVWRQYDGSRFNIWSNRYIGQ